MSTNPVNRRQHERFIVNPGYTSTSVRRHPDEAEFKFEGHIFDISEGGICFELDYPIEAGTTISMKIDLPTNRGDTGPGRAVFVTGNVIWCTMDDAGDSKMAMAITRFDREGDKERMIRSLVSQRFQRAA